jgi:hypothetical protein
VAVPERLVADVLGGAAGTAVLAVGVGVNRVTNPLLLVGAPVAPRPGDHAGAVVAITLVVQIPALGVGRRLLGQHGEGSGQQQSGEQAFHGEGFGDGWDCRR